MLEKLREFFKDDIFARDMGAYIEEGEPGYAVCSMKIEPRHKNARGAVQGGATFTLADFTFAVAANAEGRMTVSQSNCVTFLHPPKGSKLFATAKKISSGRTTCLYQVDVTDDMGVAVAHMTVNGFIFDKKVFD